MGLCILHSLGSSQAPLVDFPDYDFYEEVASGPTPDPSNAGLLGYIGPINGTWTSRIGDITPRGGRIVESAADCAALCSEKRACRSFDFGFRGLAHGTCHLSRLDRELAGRAFTVWPAFDYYERLLQNIPEYVIDSTRDLRSLAAALTDSDLLGAISGPGPFTFFAPSNQAMQSTGSMLQVFNTHEWWERVLKLHIVLGRFEAQELTDGDQLLTAHGEKLQIAKSSDGLLIGGVGVSTANFACSNGVIHIIDGLLSPPRDQEGESIIEKLNSTGFKVLQHALVSTGLASQLANRAENWTIFAPTDTALETFYLASGLTREEFSASPKITSMLRSHIALSLVRKELADFEVHEVQMLEGEPLRMQRAPGGGYFVQRSRAEASMGFDLAASDGVLFAIDTVMTEPAWEIENGGKTASNDPIFVLIVFGAVVILCFAGIIMVLQLLRVKRLPQSPVAPGMAVVPSA